MLSLSKQLCFLNTLHVESKDQNNVANITSFISDIPSPPPALSQPPAKKKKEKCKEVACCVKCWNVSTTSKTWCLPFQFYRTSCSQTTNMASPKCSASALAKVMVVFPYFHAPQ